MNRIQWFLVFMLGTLTLQGQQLSLSGSIGYYFEEHYGNSKVLEGEVNVDIPHNWYGDLQGTIGLSRSITESVVIGIPIAYRRTGRTFAFSLETDTFNITKIPTYSVHMLHVPLSMKFRLFKLGEKVRLNMLMEPGLLFQFPPNEVDEYVFSEPGFGNVEKVANAYYHINRSVIPTFSYGVQLDYYNFFCQLKQSLPYRYANEYSSSSQTSELDYRAKLTLELNIGYSFTLRR